MLKDLLQRINEDGYVSLSVLARALKASTQTVEAGLAQLIRMGYLVKETTGQDCAVACGGCPYAASCQKELLTGYTLTEKGQALL